MTMTGMVAPIIIDKVNEALTVMIILKTIITGVSSAVLKSTLTNI